MKQLFTLLALLCLTLPGLRAQDAIFGADFANGWNDPATDAVPFSASLGGSRILTTTANGAAGDKFFRLAQGQFSGAQQYGPFGCTDQDWTGGEGFSYDNMPICSQFGAFRINGVDPADIFVFKTPNTGSNRFIYWQFELPPAEFDPAQTGQVPADGAVTSTTTVSVGSFTTTEPPADQGFYLRYSTDGFATSTVLSTTPLVIPGAGASLFWDIPAQAPGTTVEYYLFSSGTTNQQPATDGSDADYRTITFLTDGGTNFRYTVQAAFPVTWSGISAEREKATSVRVRWSTASEEGASHYELECSDDNGATWMHRGVLPAENAATGADYSYYDEDTPTGDLTYRVRQVDFDATASYSPLARVAALREGVTIFPQPAGTFFTIDAPAKLRGTTVQLLDLTGRMLRNISLNGARTQVPTEGLKAGVYVLRTSAGTQRVLVR